MDKLLNRFASIVENPYPWVTQWKKDNGKKIIGCVPMAIPEEIIHAAGMLPVMLLGSDEAITLADQYAHPYICHSVRGNFDLSLKRKLDFLDGVIFSDFCLTVQMISDSWRLHNPGVFNHYLVLPKNMKAPYAKKYLLHQFMGLKAALEGLACREISEDSLKRSISTYNQNRNLLHRLFKLRRSNPELFRARDIATVVAASMLMPKEEHNQLLSQLLEEVQAKPQSSNGKTRLILSGYLCDMPELDVLDLVEELGVAVSDDDLYVGRRYFHTLADETLSPMDALAQRYIQDVPCPTKLYSKKDWADYLTNLVKEAKAEGVVTFVLKYCEAHLYDIPSLAKSLSQAGVPNLAIEMTHSGATGQVRTRLQAFLETIGGRHGS
jgi:benzoyl-CoA reductase subunit C